MKKIEIQQAADTARDMFKLSESKTNEFIKELLSKLQAPEKKDGVKKQYVFILSDPKGRLKGWDFTGRVVQIPEDDNPATALEKLHQGAYDFNRSPKGRRYPVKTVAEACEFGSARIFKERKIWVKSKEPVLVIPTNNKIPKTE